jgi:hypothetical protein
MLKLPLWLNNNGYILIIITRNTLQYQLHNLDVPQESPRSAISVNFLATD